MAYFQTSQSLNRASWGPISISEMPGKLHNRPISGDYTMPTKIYEKPIAGDFDIPDKLFDRPISGGNFDRIINAFERTNAFQCVRSSFEHGYCDKIVKFENAKNRSDKVDFVRVDSDNVDEERFTGHGDVLVSRKSAENYYSSYDRADGRLASRQTPCSDDDVAEYYQERMLYSQARQLFPLQEDLAEWINKTIGITYLTGDNFLDVLDNGVELCELAVVIRDRAKEAVQRGKIKGPVPTIKGRCWKKAARRSFFSRDNMENFITFCRELGVHENLLFESDDLVLHAQPRQVTLCLLEVARLATKYDIEPPGLVQLEREIAMEENDSGLDSAMSGLLAWQFRESSPVCSGNEGKLHDGSNKEKSNPPPSPVEMIEERESSPGDDGISAGSGEDVEISAVQVKPLSELDKRVQLATRLMQRKCNCSTGKCSKLLKVKKVGEGRYNIAGRNVFIRLLKGRHMMVRVGGGWDTLEHFLSRHDPCQVRLITPSAPTSTSPTSHTITTVDLSALNIAYSSEEDIVDANSKSSVSLSHSETSSDGKKTPPRRKSTPLIAQTTQMRKQSLTLPLNSVIDSIKPYARPKTSPSTVKSKRNSIHGMLAPRTPENGKAFYGTDRLNASAKSRSLSLTSPISSTARSVRSPIAPKFCGTDKLNASAMKSRSGSLSSPNGSARAISPLTPKSVAKKSRSVSLTSPMVFSPTTGGVRGARSPVTPIMTQSFSEISVRSPVSNSTPNKPAFLHIKAKYRSPPPREIPPR